MYVSELENKSDFIQSMKLVLYGDYSISPQIKPFESKSLDCSDCSNNQLIHFHHKQADMGQIYKAKIIFSIDKTKIKLFKKLKWFLNMIEIDYHKEKFTFEYKKWINFKRYDLKKSFELKLYEKKFSKEQKRTICTLSHRLLEESIQNDSYDDSFDEIDEKEKRTPSPRQKKLVKKDSTSPSPRITKNEKSDLKSTLRFEQDLEELASSDSTLSIVSSNSLKSSPKKGFKSPGKFKNSSKWSDDENFRSKRTPSPNSWKFELKKGKKSEWSSDDDDIRSKKPMSPSRKQNFYKEKRNEWSSEDDSYKTHMDRKFIEKTKWNDHPRSGKLSENFENYSNREQFFEREMDKENLRIKNRVLRSNKLNEDYDKFSDSPIPKFSSSLKNRLNQKEPRETSFVKESLRNFNGRDPASIDYNSTGLRNVSRF